MASLTARGVISGSLSGVGNINGSLTIPRGGGGGELVPATTTTLGGIIVGDDLTITADGRLSVQKATEVESDNTHPITSAAVYTTVGNINALLQTI